MYRGHLMNCEAKLRGRTVGGEAWARKGIKFQAPDLFLVDKGRNFQILGGFRSTSVCYVGYIPFILSDCLQFFG